MKLKLYLRMVLAVMTALFVATGCSKGTDGPDEPTGPVDDPITFELEVSNVGTGEATVAVKPSKSSAMYYCDAITKTAFDAYATEAAFLAADMKRIEGMATQEKMTLKAYLEMHGNRGEKNVPVETTEPKTAHYAYVYGIKNDGTVISKVFKAEFTSGENPVPPQGPELTISSMKAGDRDGAMKDTRIYTGMSVKKSPAVSGKYGLYPTAQVEAAIATGDTYEGYVDKNGTDANSQFLELINGEGGLGLTWGNATNPLTANTSYTEIVKVVDVNGLSDVKHMVAKTEPGSGGGTGPVLDMTFEAGVGNGTETDTKVTFRMKSSGVISGLFGVFEKTWVDNLIAGGRTYDEIISYQDEEGANGIPFSADPTWLTKLNSADGLGLTMKDRKPGTAYTLIVKVTNASGSTVKYASATTTGSGGGTPTDAYKAWLGTWTVTSAKNEVTSTPVSFDVTISQKAENSTYKVIGWGISGNRLADQVAMTFDFDSATGGFKAMNGVVVASTETPAKLPGTVEQTLGFYDPSDGKYYVLPGKLTALIATMKADKQSANVVGGTFTFKDDPTTYTVTSLDLGIWSSDYKDVWSWNPAEGFTNSPVGPYTLVKKSGASAPAKSMSVNATLHTAVNKSLIARTAVVIPTLSSVLKNASVASDGRAKFQQAEQSASAFEVAPKSAEATFEAIRME